MCLPKYEQKNKNYLYNRIENTATIHIYIYIYLYQTMASEKITAKYVRLLRLFVESL